MKKMIVTMVLCFGVNSANATTMDTPYQVCKFVEGMSGQFIEARDKGVDENTMSAVISDAVSGNETFIGTVAQAMLELALQTVYDNQKTPYSEIKGMVFGECMNELVAGEDA